MNKNLFRISALLLTLFLSTIFVGTLKSAKASPLFVSPSVTNRFFDWDEYYNEDQFQTNSIIINGISDPTHTDAKYDWGASVVLDGGAYKMWWTRQKDACSSGRDAIYYADSWDGITWYNPQEVLSASDLCVGDGVNESSEEKFHVARPSVVKVGNTYYMFYESPSAYNNGEKDNQIFVATSTNGINWNKGSNPNNPQPLIYMRPSTTCQCYYGIGQPSVFYKDGSFWIYFTEAEDEDDGKTLQDIRIRRIIMSKADVDNRVSRPWTTGDTFIAYGSGVDVKWSPALNLYVMLYSTLNNHNNPDTYNVCVYTSTNGTAWEPIDSNKILFNTCKSSSSNNITTSGAGFGTKTRGFPTLVGVIAGQPYSNLSNILLDTTLPIVFFEGTMHASNQDWRQFASTWDLRFGLVSINGNSITLQPGINVKTSSSLIIYHVWYNTYSGASLPIKRHSYSDWPCFQNNNPGRYNWMVIPSTIMNSTPEGVARPGTGC